MDLGWILDGFWIDSRKVSDGFGWIWMDLGGFGADLVWIWHRFVVDLVAGFWWIWDGFGGRLGSKS